LTIGPMSIFCGMGMLLCDWDLSSMSQEGSIILTHRLVAGQGSSLVGKRGLQTSDPESL
jgi:hypothetical protein